MKIIQQNILRVPADAVICHQVNCLGIMGGGLAKQVREQYPYVYDAYKAKDDWQVGDCQIVEVSEEPGSDPFEDRERRYIANLAGQKDIGMENMTNVDGLERSLRVARDFADANDLTLYVPYLMGCGLAGGDWNDVSAMIERVAPEAVICRYVP